MKVVNPLNRVPETEETIVMAGCHCTCYSGHQSTYNVAWLPLTPNCQCNCQSGNTANYNANYNSAYDAAH